MNDTTTPDTAPASTGVILSRPTTPTKKSKDGDTEENSSAATKIISLVHDLDVELFHNAEREPFASITVNGHRENWAIKDQQFHDLLSQIFYREEHKAPSQTDVGAAIKVLSGKALFEGGEKNVHVRVADADDCIYLDLANKSWDVVRATAHGWEIVSNPPVKFRRTPGMKALPRPLCGGDISELRRFINVGSDANWILLVAWLVDTLRPWGPRPILVLEGSHGSAKSTATRAIKSIVDPNFAALRSEPKDNRDLMIAAANNWCLAFDNFSRLSDGLSDSFCRLATGGGFSTRELYTDSNEKLFNAIRPIVINGIDVNIKRGDFLDRAIVLTLPPVEDEQRKTEGDFWREFEEVLPRILGALLDAACCALKRLPALRLNSFPRMADFAKWVIAAEPALGWPDGTFLRAYEANRRELSFLALESSPIVSAIEEMLLMGDSQEETFTGTATELLKALEKGWGERDWHDGWPRNARALSAELRRLEPNLSRVGIKVEFSKTHGRNSKRIITISRHRDQ